MNLTQWAIKWQVSLSAVEDLRREFQLIPTQSDVVPVPGGSEAANQVNIRLEASRKGCRLFRNNNGATYDETGRFIRYGLANESAQMNKKIKSSDLIGLRPIVIQQQHVGQIIGVFLAREVKPGGWQYTGTPREVAQLKFLELVAALGGDASFATGEGTI